MPPVPRPFIVIEPPEAGAGVYGVVSDHSSSHCREHVADDGQRTEGRDDAADGDGLSVDGCRHAGQEDDILRARRETDQDARALDDCVDGGRGRSTERRSCVGREGHLGRVARRSETGALKRESRADVGVERRIDSRDRGSARRSIAAAAACGEREESEGERRSQVRHSFSHAASQPAPRVRKHASADLGPSGTLSWSARRAIRGAWIPGSRS